MPVQLTNGVNKAISKKRKRTSAVEKTRNDVVKKVVKSKPSALSAEDVLEVEEAITESPQNYNKIVSLLEYLHVGYFKIAVSLTVPNTNSGSNL